MAKPVVLGLIAGGAIFLGLPIARLRAPLPRLRVFLNAFATGILLFLLWDVLTHAFAPVDVALGRLHDGDGSFAACLGWAVLLLGTLAPNTKLQEATVLFKGQIQGSGGLKQATYRATVG